MRHPAFNISKGKSKRGLILPISLRGLYESCLWSLEAAANGKDYFSSRTNKTSHWVFHPGEAAVNRTSPSAHVLLRERNGTLYIRSFGWAKESHLAADKSIWDECWSPRAAWRSPSPHLGSVTERSPRSRLRPPVGRLQGKSVGRLRHAQMSRIKVLLAPFHTGKTIAGCTGQRRRTDWDEGRWRWWSGGWGLY